MRWHSFIVLISLIHGLSIQANYLMGTVRNTLKNTAYVQRALFDYDTLMILAGALPLYALGLAIDIPIHRVFYHKRSHTNRHQLSDQTIRRVLYMTKIGIWGYTLGGFLWLDQEVQHRAQIFLIGYTSALFVKTLIKGVEWWPAKRPYNQRFEQQDIYTGFPSGQMTQITYLMTVLGLEHGFGLGVGLGMLAGAIGCILIGSNRHYVSQVVAGSALGISYGLAVHKTMHVHNAWTYTLDYQNNKPTACIGYQF